MNKLDGIMIDVTNEDIRFGVPRNRCNCPIALAIERATNAEHAVFVDSQYITIGRDKFFVDSHVASFMRSFDTDYVVNPITFTLVSAN